MDTASKIYKKREYEQLLGKEINGRYDLESLLGFGGMGAVYKALQRNMERRVALKLIPQGDPKAAARFKREALTISKLQHPNTVTVFDHGQTRDGMLFLAMEMLSGRTLGQVIKHEAPLDPSRAVHIASQVCRSLTEAHDAGIVHRDVKPDNIFLIEVDDDSDFVKVLDFGIAKSLQADDQVTLTGEGRIIGTPRYMSPEQILAEPVDRRSDIYSLACIVFEMLCGTPPFDDASTTKLMIAHAKETPPPLAERLTEDALSRIPGELEDVIRRALSKSPSERQPQIDVFRQELERAVEKLEPSPIPPGSGMRQSPTRAQGQPESSDLLDMHSSQSLDRMSQTRAERKPTKTQQSDKKEESKTRTLLLVGIVLLVLLIGAGGYVVLTQNDTSADEATLAVENEAAEPAPAPPAASDEETSGEEESPETLDFDSPEPTAPATVRLRLTTVPRGATVYVGDEKWGSTPLERAIDAGATDLELRFEKPGYQTRTRKLNIDTEPGGSRDIDISLSKKRRTQRTRPAPAKKIRDDSTTKPEETDKDETPSQGDDGDSDTQKDEPDEPASPRIDRLDDDEPTVPKLNF